MEVLLLPVDDELYAVPLAAVREVMAKPPTTALPTAAESLLGLINVRGEIVPLFDIVKLLGTGATRTTQFTTIVELGIGAAALATSSAPASAELSDRVKDSERGAGLGVYRHGDDLVTLLDVEVLLSGSS